MSRLAIVVAVLLSAGAARAESPRSGSVELGAGTFLPNVDASVPTEPGTYERVFGTGRGWMFRAGAAYSLFSQWGTLDLGVKTGYFRDSGKGLLPDGTRSGDTTTFNVVPSSLTLTYRFDLFADKVPLAPYGRVTLERYNWWVTDGGGNWAKNGATNGWSATGGLAVLLDFFDPTLARELDSDTGVNHTYLYFDVTKSQVDDFGSKKSWDLSDKDLSLSGGLLFVF